MQLTEFTAGATATADIIIIGAVGSVEMEKVSVSCTILKNLNNTMTKQKAKGYTYCTLSACNVDTVLSHCFCFQSQNDVAKRVAIFSENSWVEETRHDQVGTVCIKICRETKRKILVTITLKTLCSKLSIR